MNLILITPEDTCPLETDAIVALFENGLQWLHLRKPGLNANQLQQYLHAIPSCWYDRIVVHDQYEIAISRGINQLHLNSRSTILPDKPGLKMSRSCHTLEEIQNIDSYEYVFLSPVFDSISKTGYCRGFTNEELIVAAKQGVINHKVIALGGIEKNNISEVAALGFGGVALIGSVWKDFSYTHDIASLLKRYTELQTVCNQL